MVVLVVTPYLFASLALAEMSRWNLDPDHTTIGFQVKHMVVSKTNGKFLEYSGTVEMDPKAKEFKTIEAVIQTQSVFTDHKKRDEHLRSPDFFDAQNVSHDDVQDEKL